MLSLGKTSSAELYADRLSLQMFEKSCTNGFLQVPKSNWSPYDISSVVQLKSAGGGSIMRNGWIAKLVATVFVVSAAMPAMAGPMEDAAAAWERQDYATAEKLLRPLAEQGRAAAQHLLARMYENGQGVPRSSVEAAKWYGLAAARGHAGAQLYLANLYFVGDGVPRDYVQAYMWFSLSETAGQGEFASHGRNQVAERMTPAQIAEAERRVRAWQPTPGR